MENYEKNSGQNCVHGRTDGLTSMAIPVYLPPLCCGGYKYLNMMFQLPTKSSFNHVTYDDMFGCLKLACTTTKLTELYDSISEKTKGI